MQYRYYRTKHTRPSHPVCTVFGCDISITDILVR